MKKPPRNLAKKLRWFEQGAAAFAQVFPEALGYLGPDAPPQYVCPECPEPDDTGGNYRVQLFPRSAVLSGDLTAEHVPPKCFSGRELVLTCERCNNTAGSQLDAEARKRENPVDALLGVAKKPSGVRVTAGGHNIAASFMREERMFTLDIPPHEQHANDPKVVRALQEALPRAVSERLPININFNKDRYHSRRAKVAWLRHAYLALFAIAGYRYIFQPGLGIVRKQIKEPEVNHIARFLLVLPEERPWSERRIIIVREPEWLQSWAVQIGKFVAFVPHGGDTEFYARLAAEQRNASVESQFTGDEIAWPREPSFGLVFDSLRAEAADHVNRSS